MESIGETKVRVNDNGVLVEVVANMGEEDVCISKGGTWVGGSCQYG